MGGSVPPLSVLGQLAALPLLADEEEDELVEDVEDVELDESLLPLLEEEDSLLAAGVTELSAFRLSVR
jgi:hypothetical protein